MTSTISTISSDLGKYMLQGWVLSDQNHSCGVPLLKSKNNNIGFCVSCHHSPPQSDTSHSNIPTSLLPTSIRENPNHSIISPNNETFKPGFPHPTIPTHPLNEQRKQSDHASHLIGQKLLKGWVLLDDICPNPTCYGIPLIKSRGNKGKHCVICERTYINQSNTQLYDGISRDTPAIDNLKTSADSREVQSISEPKVAPKDDSTFQDSYSLEQSLNVLKLKLASLTSSLNTTHETVEICELTKAMTACADAIQALRRINENI